MSVVDLAARRWSEKERADEHAPRVMLVEALRQIDAGEMKPTHLILCIAIDTPEDHGVDLAWMQAGNLPHLAQSGLLMRVGALMGRPD